jgi:hypothetical protein
MTASAIAPATAIEPLANERLFFTLSFSSKLFGGGIERRARPRRAAARVLVDWSAGHTFHPLFAWLDQRRRPDLGRGA